jgi:hypothetical protein
MMGTPPERKFQRFNLSYPVRVKFTSGYSIVEVDAVSRNISIGGLLLESPCLIPCRSPVEFTITLRTGLPNSRLIKLGGAGEVVRLEPGAANDRFGIAVACAEPICHEGYLSATSAQ